MNDSFTSYVYSCVLIHSIILHVVMVNVICCHTLFAVPTRQPVRANHAMNRFRRTCESNISVAPLCPRGDWLHMIPLNVRYLSPRLYCNFVKERIWRMVLVHVGYLVLPVFGSVRNRGIYNTLFHIWGPLLVPSVFIKTRVCFICRHQSKMRNESLEMRSFDV